MSGTELPKWLGPIGSALSSINRHRGKLAAVYIIALGLFLVNFLGVHPWINDEGAYLLMADTYMKSGQFHIENGYGEMAVPQLELHSTKGINLGGKYVLAPMPPPLYPLVMLPFYGIFGIKGLALANLLGFLGCAAVVYGLAHRYFQEEYSALAALLVFSLSTIAPIFSVEIWPHGISMFLSAFPVYAALSGPGMGLALLAGVVSGIGCGIRYTNAIIAGIAFLYLVVYKSKKSAATYLMGMALPLLLILYLNMQIFGSPMSTGYGNALSESTRSYRVSNLIIGGALFLLVFEKRLADRIFRGRLADKRVFAALIILAFFSFDMLRVPAMLLFSQIVDFSFAPRYEEIWDKRALLQSSPILILSAFGALAWFRSGEKKGMLAFFTAMSLAHILFIGGFESGDGSMRTMRYYLEAIPYLSVFAAIALVDYARKRKRWWISEIAVAYIFIGCLCLAILDLLASKDVLFWTLKIPLCASFCLVLAYSSKRYRVSGNALPALIVFCLLYGMVFDLTMVLETSMSRQFWVENSALLHPLVADHSAVIHSEYLDEMPFVVMKRDKDIRIAYLEKGNLTDNIALVEHFRESGIHVYAVRGGNESADLSIYPILERYERKQIVEYGEGNVLIMIGPEAK